MVIPAGDIERLKPVIRIVVNLICRRLTEAAVTGARRDQEHRHKLLLMLDEFTKLGRLEFFESALGFLAGYGIKGMLVTQSLNEIRHVYGERTSLLDNTNVRVFYRPETLETAEYISKTLGQSTVMYQTRGESGAKGMPFNTSKNESLHIGSRPLLTAREVMELPDDEALVLIGGGKPIRAKKVAYYKDGALLPLIKPPPTIDRETIFSIESPWFSSRYSPTDEEEPDVFKDDELVLTPGEPSLKHPGKESPSLLEEEVEIDEIAEDLEIEGDEGLV